MLKHKRMAHGQAVQRLSGQALPSRGQQQIQGCIRSQRGLLSAWQYASSGAGTVWGEPPAYLKEIRTPLPRA